MIKIKKDTIFYCFICSLLITGQAFGYDYNPYEANLDSLAKDRYSKECQEPFGSIKQAE